MMATKRTEAQNTTQTKEHARSMSRPSIKSSVSSTSSAGKELVALSATSATIYAPNRVRSQISSTVPPPAAAATPSALASASTTTASLTSTTSSIMNFNHPLAMPTTSMVGNRNLHLHHRVVPRVSFTSNSGSSLVSDSNSNSNIGQGSSSSSSKPVQGTRLEKERFMEFTKILMKYLETMNPSLCKKAQLILVQYAEKHRRQEQGYNDLSVEYLKQKLRQVVGDVYWTRVEGYHKRYQQVQKAQRKRAECARIANQFTAASSISAAPMQRKK